MSAARFVVVIPTYKRLAQLNRCLVAMESQSVAPSSLIVIRRDTDIATAQFLCDYQKIKHKFDVREIIVATPGFLPPLKAGFSAADGDYVGLVDDDIVVHSNWVETAIAVFERESPRLGAISGAAFCTTRRCGNGYPAILHWCGRFATINCHTKRTKKINALMEANAVFRREAIGSCEIDLRLNTGLLAHHGLDLGLQLKNKGWEVLYEPSLGVEHLAVREMEVVRSDAQIASYINNMMIIIKKNLGETALTRFVLYNLIVGQYHMPGLLYSAIKRNTSWKLVGAARRSLVNNFTA